MVMLSNFTYHSTNVQAEDTSLNLKHYMEELKFHFLSRSVDRILAYQAKNTLKYMAISPNAESVSISENLD